MAFWLTWMFDLSVSQIGIKTAVVAHARQDTCSRDVLRHEVG